LCRNLQTALTGGRDSERWRANDDGWLSSPALLKGIAVNHEKLFRLYHKERLTT
jgi:hypothetical protein